MSKLLVGRIVSESTKEKLRGKNNSRFGIVLSDETKNKISLSHKGKKLSEEHKKKIGMSNLGKVHSRESVLRVANKIRGKNYELASNTRNER